MEGQREQGARAAARSRAATRRSRSRSHAELRAGARACGRPVRRATTATVGRPACRSSRSSTRPGSRSRNSPPGRAGSSAIAKTPFYVEAGGQVSDTGRLVGAASEATVERMRQGAAATGRGCIRSRSRTGTLRDRRDRDRRGRPMRPRDATRRNHTATHLLHAALRQVLGTHVKQAGSLVAPDRLRFDFVHFAAVTREQLDEIERIVNEQIVRNTPVDHRRALDGGGDRRRARWRCSARSTATGFAWSACPASAWSCAAARTCARPATSAPFVITEESGVAAGVRRIEALTGAGAVDWMQQQREALARMVAALSVAAGAGGRGRPAAAGRRQAPGARGRQLKMKAALGGGSGGRWRRRDRRTSRA